MLTRDLLIWEAFLRKVKGHSEVLRDKKGVAALLEVIIALFRNTIDYQVRIHTPPLPLTGEGGLISTPVWG